MNFYDVYIPSYKRAETMITHKIVNGDHVYVVCPESQLDEYKKNVKGVNFMPCPDSVEGNMANKRNWIFENAKSDYFLMIDDDIRNFWMIENNERFALNPEQFHNMAVNGFVLMEDLGTVLWGINTGDDPRNFTRFKPFNMLCVVLGPFSGWKKTKGLIYDNRLPTKEDYDMALQVLQKYHKVIRMNKYSYETMHLLGKSGGSHSIRIMDREREQLELLQKKWGSKVVQGREGKINPLINIPLKGI